MQHLEWCYLPRICKALPALAAPPVLPQLEIPQLLCTPLIAVMRILHQCRGSPKSPPKVQCLYNSYRHAHQGQALGWTVRSTQWVYFYGFCITQLHTIRLRNMAELRTMWTRKIRTTCIEADVKRSNHRTQHGLQQGCRSTTPSVSITCDLLLEQRVCIFHLHQVLPVPVYSSWLGAICAVRNPESKFAAVWL